jgi:NAD(P)-dependent dehydrogenase (short-subunit alcohol dehydrogenase family)
LITGATSGFGKLLVEEFLKNGDVVIATGRRLTERSDLLADLRSKYPQKLKELSMDVTVPSEVTAVVGQLDGLDILINNAGFGLFGPLEDLKDEEIRHQMEVNFFGTVSVTKAFLPLIRASRGKIFNFSSVFGFMGFPLTSLYCASKFAVEGLTESLRGELAPYVVQVCLIEPGGYNTNFGPGLSWSKNSASPYSSQVQKYQELRVKVSQKKTYGDPREVAQGLVELSSRSKLPMRKVFGKDGKISSRLRSILPTSVYWALMDRVFAKVFHTR